MQPVKMYTTAVCPYCIRAKQILKSKGVEQIEEIRVDTDPAARTHMMEITGRRTVLSYLLKPVLRARNYALSER